MKKAINPIYPLKRLCGKRDRRILADPSAATFRDFVRLHTVCFLLNRADLCLGLEELAARAFPTRAPAYFTQGAILADEETVCAWLADFIHSAPSPHIRALLRAQLLDYLASPFPLSDIG